MYCSWRLLAASDTNSYGFTMRSSVSQDYESRGQVILGLVSSAAQWPSQGPGSFHFSPYCPLYVGSLLSWWADGCSSSRHHIITLMPRSICSGLCSVCKDGTYSVVANGKLTNRLWRAVHLPLSGQENRRSLLESWSQKWEGLGSGMIETVPISVSPAASAWSAASGALGRDWLVCWHF